MEILVIDDDRYVRTFLRMLLEGEGHFVTEAVNGIDGERKYRDCQADLIITDIIMPGMNGKELSDKLNKIKAIPSIFVSGYSQNVFTEKGIITEDITFIQKPFTKEKLFKAINEKLPHS